MDFFNYDGPIIKYGNMLADMLILSVIWIIFCIPLVTAGASTTAAYYVATRRISEKEGYLIKDFWKSFKGEFLKITPLFIIIVAVTTLVVMNISFMNEANEEVMNPTLNIVLTTLSFVLIVELIFTSLFLFPITSRFGMSRKDLFKTAFFMANRHFLTTIILIVMLVAGIFLIGAFLFIPLLVFPGIYFYMSSYLFMRIFKKYRPEIDAMPGDPNYIPPVETPIEPVSEQKIDNNSEDA